MAQSVLVKTYLPRGLVSVLVVEAAFRGISISKLVKEAVESAATAYTLVPTSELARLVDQMEIPYVNDDELMGEMRLVGDRHAIACPYPRSNCSCMNGRVSDNASDKA